MAFLEFQSDDVNQNYNKFLPHQNKMQNQQFLPQRIGNDLSSDNT